MLKVNRVFANNKSLHCTQASLPKLFKFTCFSVLRAFYYEEKTNFKRQSKLHSYIYTLLVPTRCVNIGLCQSSEAALQRCS